MYSFFELSGTHSARIAAASGAMIITVLVLASSALPVSNAANLTVGVLA